MRDTAWGVRGLKEEREKMEDRRNFPVVLVSLL